jgi:general secretion pathway protein D
MMRTLIASFLLMLCTVPRALDAQVPTGVQRTQQGILLNFQDVDLTYVISALAQLASVNVALIDFPQKNVTVRTSQPVQPADVINLIRELAAANGISVIEQNGFLRLQGSGVQTVSEPRNLYIIKLRHARAPVLATTLQNLFGGAIRATSAAQATTTLSAQLRQMELQQQQAALGQRAGVVPQQLNVQIPRIGELQDNVTIVPDETTNSLLIRATPADYQIVQQAIQGLDLRPLQVMIEVIIAEVRRSNELNVGTSFGISHTDGGRTIAGNLPADSTPGRFSLSVIRTGDVNVEATLTALATTGNVRILSRPLIQAQNNQEATIRVGAQVPFVQTSRQFATDTGVRDDVIQYRDVATSLTITPTINDEGYVNLAIVQEVNNLTADVLFGAPIISNREATTQVLARHGQTIVIGGLVDRTQEKSRSGIPFLKDIPVLGFLFGNTRTNNVNSELFLFLTPYVVATDADADRVRQEIENKAELLQKIIPIPPLTPTVVRLPGDTIRPPRGGGAGRD